MNHTPPLILVIDDDPGMCRVARALFEAEGYAVLTTQDAAGALSSLSAEDGPRPALIVLDLHMPGMDGATFAREYQARHREPVPLVVLSADVDAAGDALPWAAGRLGKPFDVDRILDVVRRCLDAEAS